MLDIKVGSQRDIRYLAETYYIKSDAYVWRGDHANRQSVVYAFRVNDDITREHPEVQRQIERAERSIRKAMMPGVMRHWMVEKTTLGQLIRPVDPQNPRAKTLPHTVASNKRDRA